MNHQINHFPCDIYTFNKEKVRNKCCCDALPGDAYVFLDCIDCYRFYYKQGRLFGLERSPDCDSEKCGHLNCAHSSSLDDNAHNEAYQGCPRMPDQELQVFDQRDQVRLHSPRVSLLQQRASVSEWQRKKYFDKKVKFLS